MRTKWFPVVLVVLALAVSSGVTCAQEPEQEGDAATQAAFGTAFSFSGYLVEVSDGSPANGNFDFRFTLHG